ncbi:hypothetical protein J2X72_005054 [Phyllobacterium sp. 1468]|nr:hypothetical protein [Phyllobacterium sp. 1468]
MPTTRLAIEFERTSVEVKTFTLPTISNLPNSMAPWHDVQRYRISTFLPLSGNRDFARYSGHHASAEKPSSLRRMTGKCAGAKWLTAQTRAGSKRL